MGQPAQPIPPFKGSRNQSPNNQNYYLAVELLFR